jgi:hypothetical protein
LPLSEKERIEVYLPGLPRPAYQDLLAALEEEFTYTFGGCTVIGDLEGNNLSRLGSRMRDRINLIYTDTVFSFVVRFARIERYADELRHSAFEALDEEAVLVACWKVVHSEQSPIGFALDQNPEIRPGPSKARGSQFATRRCGQQGTRHKRPFAAV